MKMRAIKKIVLSTFCVIVYSNVLFAQDQTPQLLKEPASWQFERFSLPPEFAPNIPYKGAEELRFSPGMFVKDSTTYFTYAFVAELDNVNSVSQDDIRNYLLNYFKGLCSSTAKQRHLSIDTSKISVAIEKKRNTGNDAFYDGTLNIFGVFTDGAPVKLNVEIKVMDNKASKIYFVFVASPLDKTDNVWKELHSIQREFKIPKS
jgi:hypothetical protein